MTTTPALRRLIDFADDEECSRVSVKGDATYCIKGPVCGKSQGACPAEGDAAVRHCLQTSRSFSNGCVAPVDAQCVISVKGRWECVFPDTNDDSSAATGSKNETTQTTMALSSSTQTTTTPSDSANEASGHTPNAALNIVVGVSCCILALVGLAFIKKRRSQKRKMKRCRNRSSMLTDTDSDIVTL